MEVVEATISYASSVGRNNRQEIPIGGNEVPTECGLQQADQTGRQTLVCSILVLAQDSSQLIPIQAETAGDFHTDQRTALSAIVAWTRSILLPAVPAIRPHRPQPIPAALTYRSIEKVRDRAIAKHTVAWRQQRAEPVSQLHTTLNWGGLKIATFFETGLGFRVSSLVFRVSETGFRE